MNRLLVLILFGTTSAGLIYFGQDFLTQDDNRVVYEAADSWGFVDSLFVLVRENESADKLDRDFQTLTDFSAQKKEVIDLFIAGKIDLDQASLMFKEIIAARKNSKTIYSFFPRLTEQQILNSMVINWASYHTADNREVHDRIMADLMARYGDRYFDLGLAAGQSATMR